MHLAAGFLQFAGRKKGNETDFFDYIIIDSPFCTSPDTRTLTATPVIHSPKLPAAHSYVYQFSFILNVFTPDFKDVFRVGRLIEQQCRH